MSTAPTPAVGLVLAAGAGRRMGGPKALVADASGPWLPRAVAALRDGGCPDVYVVLGCSADLAADLVPGVHTVLAEDWADGMGASLRAGLAAIADVRAEAVVVTLVDLPDVGGDVVRRLLDRGSGPDTLARATYRDVLGHPVLVGRSHWAAVSTSAQGDRGAREYLATHGCVLVECGDLATGVDVDTPPAG